METKYSYLTYPVNGDLLYWDKNEFLQDFLKNIMEGFL